MPTKRTISVTVTRHPVGFTLHQDICDEDGDGTVAFGETVGCSSRGAALRHFERLLFPDDAAKRKQEAK